MINKRFSKLTVLSSAGKTKTRVVNYLCKCDCGKEKIIRGDALRLGRAKSCGCERINATKNATKKNCVMLEIFGMKKTRREWSEESGTSIQVIKMRQLAGYSDEDSVFLQRSDFTKK